MADHNAVMSQDERIIFRIGINLGDVIIEADDIYGDGVNIAARLEALAEPGGICISGDAFRQVRGKVDTEFVDMGERTLKNIAHPVRVYAIDAGTLRPSSGGDPTKSVPRLSIVVLPFASLSPDPEQEYFADAITEDLTTDLSRIADSFVIARSTAFTYKGRAVDVRQVARELGVRYVLEGSVRWTGERVQVNMQLIEGESGSLIFADRFAPELRDLIETQSEIVGRLARTLNTELVRDIGRRIEEERSGDPNARDLVMRAKALTIRLISVAADKREFMRRDTINLLEQALTLDPGSIEARIHLALILVADVAGGHSSSIESDKARAEHLVHDALERDPNQSSAHAVMGLLHRLKGQWTESQIELETAIALDQNSVFAITQLARTLMMQRKPKAAIPHLERALRLDPRAPSVFFIYFSLGTCQLGLSHIDDAIELYRRSLALNSAYWYAHVFLAAALGLNGDIDGARRAIADAVRVRPGAKSIEQLRTIVATRGHPQLDAWWEEIIYTGLRRAGFPEE